MSQHVNSLSTIGFAALLGIAKSYTSSSGGMYQNEETSESILKQYFAIPPSKKIPKSYLRHELARLTVLPENLRTEDQKFIIDNIQIYMSN